jgi:UDP-N-acetylmuramyl tripeptide synthase
VIAAGGNDIIALLGKGAEEYQIIGVEKIPFSDQLEAKAAMKQWKAS